MGTTLFMALFALIIQPGAIVKAAGGPVPGMTPAWRLIETPIERRIYTKLIDMA